MKTNRAPYKQRTAATLAAAAVVVTLVSAAGPAGTAEARPERGRPCDPAWQTVDAPTPPTLRNRYQPVAVEALAPDNVLFASTVSQDYTSHMPWLLRWDGTSVQPADEAYPWTDPVWSDVSDMSFDSPDHGWILASDRWDRVFPHTVRWQDDRWTRVPMDTAPDPEAAYPVLGGITSLAPDDAWAVGFLQSVDEGDIGALIQHWDGIRWQVVDNPTQQSQWAILHAVDGVSPTDAWTVGRKAIEGTTTMVPQVQRWDGAAWREVDLPPIPEGTLTAVTATSTTDVWATGWDGRQWDTHARPLVMHYDGTEWTVVDLPDEIRTSYASSIYAASPTDVWITTNTFERPDQSSHTVPGFMHWDGTEWTHEPWPGGTDVGRLYFAADIDGTGSGDIWATALSRNTANLAEPYRVLVAHYGCQGRGR